MTPAPKRRWLRIGIAALAVLAMAGCDRITSKPTTPVSLECPDGVDGPWWRVEAAADIESYLRKAIREAEFIELTIEGIRGSERVKITESADLEHISRALKLQSECKDDRYAVFGLYSFVLEIKGPLPAHCTVTGNHLHFGPWLSRRELDDVKHCWKVVQVDKALFNFLTLLSPSSTLVFDGDLLTSPFDASRRVAAP